MAIWIVAIGAALIFIVVGVKAWKRKRREAQIEKEHAEDQKNPMTAGMARPVWTREEARNTPLSRSYPYNVPAAPQPTVVHQSSGMDPLMAGIIGYGLAGGFSSKESHAASHSAPLESCKPEERETYTPSSSSYESSSSDSGSSYDSGGSSDSGGGGGGGD